MSKDVKGDVLKKLADEPLSQFLERQFFYNKSISGGLESNKALAVSMTWRNMKFLKCRYSLEVEKRVLALDPMLVPHPPKEIKCNLVTSNIVSPPNDKKYEKRKYHQIPHPQPPSNSMHSETDKIKRRCYSPTPPTPPTHPMPFVYTAGQSRNSTLSLPTRRPSRPPPFVYTPVKS